MQKAARIAAPIATSKASLEKSDSSFASIALFSGIGLLVSLLAMIIGIQGGWY